MSKSGFVMLLALAIFSGCLVLAAPDQSSSSSFSGTGWKSTERGAKSVIKFESDGQWTEAWKRKRLRGHWVANADNTAVTVTRGDGTVIHYSLSGKNLVREVDRKMYRRMAASESADADSSFGTATPPAAVEHSVATVKLTEDQARAVVLIKGDNAEGTGFLIKTADGPVVVTNIHVISNNPNLKITDNTGAQLTILSYKGATDRDLAMIAIKAGNYSYIDLATDVSGTVQPGDEVITPGNSEGGEVMLNTDGKVLGVGPERVEFDNPVYHGNSGGPVFHVKSGKVIAVVTEAVKVDVSDEVDKASFANRHSAIGSGMRYFGLRLDTAQKWETYDWKMFLNESAFLEQFDTRSRCLDSYLNGANDQKPEDILWRQDEQIVKANNNYFGLTAGADGSQRMDAIRALYAELGDIADVGMEGIQNSSNFYTYYQQQARDEIAYRQALKKELDAVGNDVSRIGSLARRNR
jgi:hypothetical protein